MKRMIGALILTSSAFSASPAEIAALGAPDLVTLTLDADTASRRWERCR